jgi:hypothetical protein
MRVRSSQYALRQEIRANSRGSSIAEISNVVGRKPSNKICLKTVMQIDYINILISANAFVDCN